MPHREMTPDHMTGRKFANGGFSARQIGCAKRAAVRIDAGVRSGWRRRGSP